MNNANWVRRTLLFLLIAPASPVRAQQPGWPVMPTNQEHPIGNNLGEFWVASQGPYQHTGIDILATPYSNSGAPWVVATVGGEVVQLNNQDQYGQWNEIHIKSAAGIVYRYMHLAYGSFAAEFEGTFNAGMMATAGMQLARIHPWQCSAYSHLHYDLFQGANFLNPLEDIAPNPDDFAPQIPDIRFAARNSPRWSEFGSAAGKACAVVKGNVDIIAQLHDQDDAGAGPSVVGAGNVGVYDLRWRVCAKGAPTCDNWNDTHRFGDMPTAWAIGGNSATRSQFSVTPDWVSTANECSAQVDKTFRVVTGLAPSGWNTTTGGKYPDGSYTVSVEATDFAGNVTTRTAHACVQNGTACTTDLTIRDGDNDDGATPYLDSPLWLSPDIKVNRGTVDDSNIKTGRANVVEVQVQNTGSCTLPVGTNYNVCLGWSPSSGSVPHPIPASQTVGCQTQTVAVAGWMPGTGKLTSFSWTPATGTLPPGENSLVAWSDMPADPAQSTTSVFLDNNRAQRTIAFTDAPLPLPPSDLIVE